jgi:dipeptidyl aminopeptidase/acylaminoacyl peptidase
MRTLAILCTLLLAATLLFGSTPQGKKPLDHTVYDGWNRISGESISNDGKWVVFSIEPQEGDSRLVIYNTTTGKADTVQRGTSAKISQDSRFVVFTIKPFFADVRKAKIAKKKADDMPKDSLGIVEFGRDSVVRVARVKSFMLPEKGTGWVAYQLEKSLPKTDTAKATPKKDGIMDATGDDKDKKEENGTTLILRELATGQEYQYPFVSEYAFAKYGRSFIFASTGNDSTLAPAVFLFTTADKRLDTLSVGRKKYKQVALDDDGVQAAFLVDSDTSKAKQRYFALYYWKSGKDSASALVDTATAGFPKHWLVSENRQPDFSRDGKRLLFGTAPVPMPEDTTMNDEVTAKLDVWNWQDGYIQTQQLKDLDVEKKRSYLAAVDPASRTFAQLATLEIPTVTVGDEGNAQTALGVADVPYRKMITWENVPFADFYIINAQTGAATRVMTKHKGGVSLSPAARYLYWYDLGQRHWFTMDVATQKTVKVSAAITVPLYNELNDLPDDPGAHGALGWTAGDSTLLLYDRFDIWSTDPTGTHPATNLTAGSGRNQKLAYRYIQTDPDQRFIPNGSTLLLSVFDRTSKKAGFATLPVDKPGTPRVLRLEPYIFGAMSKARNDSICILTRSNFEECPDLYLSGMSLASPRRITDINPQQKEYLWGTVELVQWKATDNTPLEGLLYKPENFDPKHKYPMLVYYYERNSDLLFRYMAPAPSRSIINPSYCVSNGYIVFIPDIRYRIGHPGKSAYECIIPGVKKLIAAGFVDPKRIGIQGQSWGGYQTAYLVTQTPMFAAAMAGAPVSNMTSAYGGIRWESGLTRIFQYEKAQSRIGATLWEKRDLYIDNSPLFFADKVTTPIMIMANDNDGAVPWWQGIEFFNGLRRLGKQTWMVVYNGEEHNLTLRKNCKDLSVRMMQFFDHFLKDAPMPVWMKEGLPAINKGKTLGLELEKKDK